MAIQHVIIPACLLVIFVVFDAVSAQEENKTATNLCRSTSTCRECIAAGPLCAWCGRENFTETRCDYYSVLQASRCNDHPFSGVNNIEFPSNEAKPTKPKELSQPGVDASPADVVQIMPQQVHLKIRPKDPFKLDIKFRQAKDYPVDLYYLMDLSKSMEDDKDKLASLGNLLAESMGKITRNFRLGFGSFVDKTVMPYVSTVPEKMMAPCIGCAAPYGFQNHMELNEKTEQFAVKVRRARVSGNLDAPEGGFDAIMQAVVCHNEINWREKSRKMLVFSTDSGFHYAGDGKLGGIVTPNDGMCHLNKDGVYTESTKQDYPSLSQIRHKISEKKVHIIFAVTAGQVEVYKELSRNLEGAYCGQLENDSSNVVQLVRDQYAQITSEVELKDNATENVAVSYYSSCLGGAVQKTKVCKGLKIGDTVSFSAEIELISCPKDPSEWKQQFVIEPIGLNEAVVVNLQMICECGCESAEKEELNSPKCEGLGTFECGVCSCYDGRFGRKCECDATYDAKEADESKCRMNNASATCSGRGTCSCGICVCQARSNPEEIVDGDFCECDNFSCDRNDGKVCSGPDHGKCVCGICDCLPGWKGKACQCLSDTDVCKGPNGQVCSGHGTCECGRCVCKDNHSGTYCQDCPTCNVKCVEFRDCVQCQAFGTGKLKDNCNCSFEIEMVPEVKIEKDKEQLCVFTDEDDCKFKFVYGYNNESRPEVRVQETKECPSPVNILMIVLAVIGGIVLIGLVLLLIWKLLTTIHDRREFAKFEKERQMAKWDTGENPIYKQATTTFQNPTYGKK